MRRGTKVELPLYMVLPVAAGCVLATARGSRRYLIQDAAAMRSPCRRRRSTRSRIVGGCWWTRTLRRCAAGVTAITSSASASRQCTQSGRPPAPRGQLRSSGGRSMTCLHVCVRARRRLADGDEVLQTLQRTYRARFPYVVDQSLDSLHKDVSQLTSKLDAMECKCAAGVCAGALSSRGADERMRRSIYNRLPGGGGLREMAAARDTLTQCCARCAPRERTIVCAARQRSSLIRAICTAQRYGGPHGMCPYGCVSAKHDSKTVSTASSGLQLGGGHAARTDFMARRRTHSRWCPTKPR